MPLPTPEQIIELQALLPKGSSDPNVKKKYGKSDQVKTALIGMLKEGIKTGARTGAQTALTQVSGTTAAFGTIAAVFPVGAALAPWMGAATIAGKADGIYSLHDLRQNAESSTGSYYPCSCGKCAEGLQYVIDKKELKIGIYAVSIFTAGAPLAATKLNSVRKSFQSDRPKERYSKQFIESANNGCLNATVAIMLLCGKWSQNEAAKKSQYITPLTCMLAEDGWKLLKSKW